MSIKNLDMVRRWQRDEEKAGMAAVDDAEGRLMSNGCHKLTPLGHLLWRMLLRMLLSV